MRMRDPYGGGQKSCVALSKIKNVFFTLESMHGDVVAKSQTATVTGSNTAGRTLWFYICKITAQDKVKGGILVLSLNMNRVCLGIAYTARYISKCCIWLTGVDMQ